MKITREPLGEHLERFEVSIARTDWYEEYEKQLRAARREMSVPGFRKGQAPLGLVAKRMGGEEFMFRFVNDAQSRGIGKFVEEQGIEVAYPFVPSEAGVPDPDFQGELTITLRYDVVVAPRYELPKELSWSPVEVEATEAQWDACCDRILEANMTWRDADEADEGTIMWLARADEGEEESEGEQGNARRGFSVIYNTLTEDGKALFHGRKVGDVVAVPVGAPDYGTLMQALRRGAQAGQDAQAGAKSEEALRVKLTMVQKSQPSEMSWEFYDRYFALHFLSQLPGQSEEKTDDVAEVRRRFHDRYLTLVRDNARISNGLSAFEHALAAWEWRVPESHLKKMQRQEDGRDMPAEYTMERIKRMALANQLVSRVGEEALQREENKKLAEWCLNMHCFDMFGGGAEMPRYGIMPGMIPVGQFFMHSLYPREMESEEFQLYVRSMFTYVVSGRYLLEQLGVPSRKVGVDQLNYRGEVLREVEERKQALDEKWARWRAEMEASRHSGAEAGGSKVSEEEK